MGFAGADLREDALLGGRVRLWQPLRGYRAATDPVMLAAAVPARAGEEVLDLGCGTGAAGLCLAARVPGLRLFGVELQADYADLARRNAGLNGAAFSITTGDLAHLPAPVLGMSFDHVMANPPFFAAADGSGAADPGRETAQRLNTPLATWLDVALRRLKPKGTLTVINRIERLPEMLTALAGRPAGRVILQARKGVRGPFRLLSPFILHEGPAHLADADDFTQAATAVLRDAAALPFDAGSI
jgi:tRNA1Val (adenine37-N6)-methyltransferase